MSRELPLKKLVLVPAVLTLAVTLVRLLGELMGGSQLLFNRDAGGPMALVGIVWLIPVFGFYFGWRLAAEGFDSVSPWRTVGVSLLVFALIVALMTILQNSFEVGMPPAIWFANAYSIGIILVARLGWKELWKTLLVYGYAARIPVAVIMLFAILGDWGTHYDVPPRPEFPAMNALARYFLIGFLPQLIFWIGFTLVVGGLFGGFGQALARLLRRPAQAS